MTNEIVPVIANSGVDRFMQKCIISAELFKATNLTVGDYVTIQTSGKMYICRIYTTPLPYSYIYVDDIVTSINVRPCNDDEVTNIPDDLISFKPGCFERISVKVVYKDENILPCDKTVYEDVIRKILKGYVVRNNCVVNCNGLKIAEFFHINSILISGTFPETLEYGKLLKSSEIEMIDLFSVEQMLKIKEFQCIQLGGINDTLNTLKSYLCLRSSRVLVSGPSGSGKSSIIKKFCTNIKCSFSIIDGLKNVDLLSSTCDTILSQFSNYLKIFPNHTCVLFIDHIDVIAPSRFKQKLTNISMLVNLINRLTDFNVSIIASTVHRKNIDFRVASLFVKEVHTGMPSLQQRKEIMIILTESLDCAADCDKVAQITPGFLGHDLSLLVNEALASRKKLEDFKESDSTLLTIEDFQTALARISPSVLKTSVWNMKVKPVYWNDIGGMFHIKQRLQMCIEWPLQNPEIFKKVDLPCPRGVLLFGPPGCCKTTLARGLATECSANFFCATPAQIYSPYVGESEKNISELFYQARISAPSIIFLDELDSLVSQRKMDQKAQGIGEKVLSALLNEMDGFGTKVQVENTLRMQKMLNNEEAKNNSSGTEKVEHSNDDVIVVAATNRPDLIDDALLRPGRFDIIMYVPPPNEEERESILQTLTANQPVQNVNLKEIAKNTSLFSGADLKLLCNEAAMNALRHDMSASYVTEENFSEALAKIHPSISKQQIEMYENLSSKYGTFIK